MDRQDAIDRVYDAIGDVNDVDVTLTDFAKAAVNVLGWHALPELPEPKDVVVCTNGESRWLDQYDPDSIVTRPWLGDPLRHEPPTHWHPILDLPQPV